MINIKPEILELSLKCEKKLKEEFNNIDRQALKNSLKVLEAFHKYNVSETYFTETTGYGYGDIGRDKIEDIFAKVLGAESALVRNQFISGSHALTVALFGLLRPKDTLLSITGTPYDTLHEVIGLKENASSLKAFGINYAEIDIINNDFNYQEIAKFLKKQKVKRFYMA